MSQVATVRVEVTRLLKRSPILAPSIPYVKWAAHPTPLPTTILVPPHSPPHYYLTSQRTGKIKAQKNPGISAGAVGVASCDSLAIGGFLGGVGVGLGCPFGDKLDKAKTLRLGERFKRGQLVGNRYRLFAGGRE